MTRRFLDLEGGDVQVLARAIGTDAESLRGELERTPRYANEILRRPEVFASIVSDTDPDHPAAASPLLFFAVLVHRSADELTCREWVEEWVGPKCRLPVFDVEPLLEFADAPGRLVFTTRLLVDFTRSAKLPVPADHLDLEDLVKWLGAAEHDDKSVLLRRLGDLALFRAGVFPDASGAKALSAAEAEHLGRSVQMNDDELDDLVDHGSFTPGLDALETLSSAWYRAAAELSPSAPTMLHDVANRIRAARRFLNYVADRYLFRMEPGFQLGT